MDFLSCFIRDSENRIHIVIKLSRRLAVSTVDQINRHRRIRRFDVETQSQVITGLFGGVGAIKPDKIGNPVESSGDLGSGDLHSILKFGHRFTKNVRLTILGRSSEAY